MRTPLIAAVLVALVVMVGGATDRADARTLDKAFFGPTQLDDGQSAFPTYQDLGVDVFEKVVSWDQVARTAPADPTNPNDPAYQWPADLDYAVQQAQEHGMRMLLLLVGTPPWANGGKSVAYPPSDPAAFADFATAASRRYPAVHQWMIWGEPCKHYTFQPITVQSLGSPLTAAQKRQPQPYAELLDAAYGALKAADPANVVIGGNTWSVCDIRPLDWVRYLKLPNGKRPRMDLFGHNPFTFYGTHGRTPPPDWHLVEMPQLPLLQQYIDKYFGRPGGKRIGLWLSEFTLPTGPDSEFNFRVSERDQARQIKQSYKLAASVPTVKSFPWIFLEDTPASTPADMRHTGGLLRADGTKKPGYFAFKSTP